MADPLNSSQTKLFILSDPPIHAVFSDDNSKRDPSVITDHQRAVMDELGLSADVVGASSIFTGDEEVFAFARAIVSVDFPRSRIVQSELTALPPRSFATAESSHRDGLGAVGEFSSSPVNLA